MQTRETYVGTTRRCSPGPHITNTDSSHPVHVYETPGFVGDSLHGGLTTLEGDEVDRPWGDQQSAVLDVDYDGRYYDQTTTVRRSCDVRRRRANCNGSTTLNDFRVAQRCPVYYDDSVSSPASWPDNG